MKGKKMLRVALDVLMTVMIVFEMLIQFTGEFLHEVVGFAFFATVVAHVLLSATWVKKTAHAAQTGKMNARRTALAVVGILLAITTVVLGMSSVAISGLLASAGFTWTLGSYALWASVHTVSAYALCALVVVHLAMHWAFLASAFKVPYDPSRRRAIATGVNAVAAVGVVALGVTAAGKTLPQVADYAVAATGPDGSGFAEGQVSDLAEPASTTAQAESTASSEGSAASSTSDSSAASATSGKESHGKRGSSSSSSASPASSGVSGADASGAGASAAPSDAGDSAGPSAAGASASSPATSSQQASNASGICTLCRKQCPLSAPKCDKPYAAGLL